MWSPVAGGGGQPAESSLPGLQVSGCPRLRVAQQTLRGWDGKPVKTQPLLPSARAFGMDALYTEH